MSWFQEKIWNPIDQALFSYGSPVTLGVLRILIGGLTFLSLLSLWPVFQDFFTENGLYPADFAVRWSDNLARFAPLTQFTDGGITVIAFWATVACALLTCIGLFTRVSSILLFLGVVALHHRNPDILNSGDTLVRQFLFFLAIGPSGTACSVDRLLRVKKNPSNSELQEISVWPVRLFQFQLAIVYFTTVWWKMTGTMWRDGTATWYPARLAEFDRFPYPDFIREMPMVMVTTYGTLIVELALATLVFAKPMRKWVLLAGLLMHGWIEYSMNIPFFSWLITAAYVSFYEGEEVTAWFDRLASKIGRPSLFQIENSDEVAKT